MAHDGIASRGRERAAREPLTSPEVRLIALESLQWCANNAVYFLGLIGMATYDLAADAFVIAAITLARNLATALANAASGPVIDRYGPRRTALGTLAAVVVVSLVVAVLPPSVPVLVFAAVALGLCGGSINTCTRTYPVYLVSGKERLSVLNGLMVFYSDIAFTIGPLVGAALVGTFPTRYVYFFMAACMAVAFALTWGCREQVVPERGAGDREGRIGMLNGMREGARIVFGSRFLRVLFLAGFLGFFAFGAFDSLESLFYRDVLQVDIVWLGILSAVSGVGSSVGAFLLTRVNARKITMGLLLGSLFFVGVGSMVYTGTGILTVAIVGQAITGLAFGIEEPAETVLVQEATPMEYLGRVMGFTRLGLMSAGVLPLLVAPFLAEALGVQAVLFGASAIIAVMGAIFYLRYRDLT
jgi:MFS family permease